MQLISAQTYFKQAMAFMEGVTEDGQPHERNLAKCEAILHEILNYNVGNLSVRYALGSLNLAKGNYGLAIQLLSQCTAEKRDFGEAWNNLGLAFKNVPDFERAEIALKNAIRSINPSVHADIYCNLAALQVSRNKPKECLHYVKQALERDPTHDKAIWHRALAMLELRRWEDAWDDHEKRLGDGAPGEIAPRNYHGPDGQTPDWDGKSPGLIVIHGEQGMGDEVMFASVIPDALKVEGCRFVLEPNPRLDGLFKRSFPNAEVYGTNDTDGNAWIDRLGKPEFKCAIGSLPRFFRRSDAAFPGSPYLVADPAKRSWWGEKLRSLPRKPNLGIAWQGGVQQTRYDARSFHPSAFKPLFEHIDANWISLQYDQTAQLCVQEVKDQLGVKINHWPKAVEQKDPDTKSLSDLDELTALISKLDLVITVCQTAVHIAGALGVPTLCLVPSEPSWRYGAGESEDMPWYSSVRLLRMKKDTKDWKPVIERASIETEAFLKIMDTAAHAHHG